MSRFLRTHGLHRRLEGWPLVFTVLTVLAISVGTIVEFAPIFLVGGAVEPMETLEPYTPLELVGRDMYIAEGCNNCHSQQVRPFQDEVMRYGPVSTVEEGAYETPHLWGSKRTGPDLARVGGKYPHLWHVRHMEQPRSTSPNSIMPPYAHMLTTRLDLEDVTQRMRGLRRLGIPYSDADLEGAVGLAQAQADSIAAEVVRQGGPDRLADKEIIAMVAYLQRLGVDRAREVSRDLERAEPDLELHEQRERQQILNDTAVVAQRSF
ncbi:cytochrome-c oxidase, cbb3-type subunit II [Rubrivirga sp.]|uniref:cytochrome-c oxidase, cbb3-type subunit II n=1 Tax=Rubrivirga sp. TaxID=1885344 RepID=UPI003C717F20